jgi:hypothetical protein
MDDDPFQRIHLHKSNARICLPQVEQLLTLYPFISMRLIHRSFMLGGWQQA